MIDNLSILLSHALLAFALWQLLKRPELDIEPLPVPDTEPEGFGRQQRPKTGKSGVASDA